jgi:hypothetical protein
VTKAFNIWGFMAAYSAVLGNALILFGNIGKFDDPSQYYLLSLSFADLVLGITVGTMTLSNLIHDGYAMGISFCIASYYATITSSACTLLSLMFAAVDRYEAVTMRSNSQKTIFLRIGLVWSIGLLTPFLPIPFQKLYQSIELEQSFAHCLALWRSREPVSIFLSITCIAIIAVSCGVTAFCYARVYYIFRLATMNHSRSKTIQYNTTTKQQKVFQKCIMITLSFVVCWTPQLLKMLYELCTGKEAPLVVSSIASCFAMTNSAINPVLLYKLDNRIRVNVKRLLE